MVDGMEGVLLSWTLNYLLYMRLVTLAVGAGANRAVRKRFPAFQERQL